MRIPGIDSLRGLAAVSVCLYHFVCTTTGYVSNETISDAFHWGEKGVQVFFILSGIVIPLALLRSDFSLRKTHVFLAKRFTRIMLPFWAALGVTVAYLLVRNYTQGNNPGFLMPDAGNMFTNAFWLVPFTPHAHWLNPVFWTLAIEVQYYIALALLFPLVMQPRVRYRALFFVVVAVMPFLPASKAFFLHWAPYFGLGIAWIIFQHKKITRYEYIAYTLMCALVVFHVQGFADLCIGIGTLMLVSFFGRKRTAATEWLGEISYSLYLVHTATGSAIINLLSHQLNTPLQKVLVIMAGFVLSVMSAWVMYMLVEKPAMKLAQRIGRSTPNTTRKLNEAAEHREAAEVA
ncbi:MAG: acyltransferase [Bacteroidetes bacterium]|nr:acyltransferase [Bacteroidota bacterium]